MGNREALLHAARTCLLERGHANTTARDIAAAAGVSLAAIGYHFGSKDELLTQAAAEATGDALGAWIDDDLRSLPPGTSPGDALAGFCARLPDGFAQVRTQLLVSFENTTRLARAGEPSEFMVQAVRQTTAALGVILGDVHPELTPTAVAGLAQLYNTVINGLAVLWVASPRCLPAQPDLRHAIDALTAPSPTAPGHDGE